MRGTGSVRRAVVPSGGEPARSRRSTRRQHPTGDPAKGSVPDRKEPGSADESGQNRVDPRWILLSVLAAYVTVIVWGSANHEPWRDEVVAMSVARGSPTLWDLWTMMRHEGHPILWYLCLRV